MVGNFLLEVSEMAVTRKVCDLTVIVAECVTMITPNDVLIEFPVGSLISEIAQILHHVEE